VADYAAVDDVRKAMPGGASLSDLTVPSAVDAAAMITEASAQIDVAIVSGGGALPVTNSSLLKLFLVRTRREVAYSIMATKGTWAPGTPAPFWAKWHDEFEAMLKKLADGDMSIEVGVGDETPDSHNRDADPEDSSDDRNPSQVKDYTP
jgi:hypothetical protein